MTFLRSTHDSGADAQSLAHRPPIVGERAPELAHHGNDVHARTLLSFRGSPVVLAFSPARWDPGATEHIANYNKLISRLPGLAGARLLRVGREAPWRELTFADGELSIPIISDGGAALSRLYGVENESAVFVIDADGVIRWRHLQGDPLAVSDEIARALAAPASDGSAPADTAWSRREFVATTMAASFAMAFLPFTRRTDMKAQTLAATGAARAPGTVAVTLRVNGRDLALSLEPRVTLLDTLREYVALPGTKKGCDHGQCGACTVHIDGRRVLSCLTFAVMQQGKAITTIEGLAQSVGATGDALHPMQEAFLAHDGFQCGYCTPGQIMSACAMVKEPWGADDGDVREAMSGNICRCGAYPNIVAAIQEVRRGTTSTANGASEGGVR